MQNYNPFENIDYSIELLEIEKSLIAEIKAKFPALDCFWIETPIRFVKSRIDLIKDHESSKKELTDIIKHLEQSVKIRHVSFKTNKDSIQINHPDLINQLWDTVLKFHGLRYAAKKPVITENFVMFPDNHELKIVTKHLHKKLNALLKHHSHASFVLCEIFRFYDIASIKSPNEYDGPDSYQKYCDDRIRAILNS